MAKKKKTSRGIVTIERFLIIVVAMLLLYFILSYHFTDWQWPDFFTFDLQPTEHVLTNYWPISEAELEIIESTGYIAGYDDAKKQALWVLYGLYMSDLEKPRYTRPKNSPFKVDYRLKNASAHPSDYTNSGYDRGHLAPSADFAHDEELMKESFLMSNIAPQVPALNRGSWKNLEDFVRKRHQQEGDLIVMVGPIFRNDRLTYIGGQNQVAVPDSFFKIIYHPYSGKAQSFIMDNSTEKQSLDQSLSTVGQIEALTGLIFFSTLGKEGKEALEAASTLAITR